MSFDTTIFEIVSSSPVVTGLGWVFGTPRTESCSSQRRDFLATTQGEVVSERETVYDRVTGSGRSAPGNLETNVFVIVIFGR